MTLPSRRARRARVLAAMEEADVDFLIVGREGNARYVSGAPRLWTAGSRAFGPGCVFVRENGAVHLLSTWDEGIPEEIPHENLYGITFNALNFVTVLSKIEGAATAKRVATDSMSGSSANLLAQGVPGGRVHRRRADAAPDPPGQEPRGDRGHPGVGARGRGGARRGDEGVGARRDRAAADRDLHGGHGGGGGHDSLRTGRGLDHLAPGPVAADQPRYAGATRRPGGLRGRRRPRGLFGGGGPHPRSARGGSCRLRVGPAHQCPVGAPPRRLPGRRPARRAAHRVRRRRRAPAAHAGGPRTRAGLRPPARHPRASR